MISAEDVRQVAQLAKLSLTDTEVATYTAQLTQVLGHFETLQTLDVSDVPPSPRALPLTNVWRPDEPGGNLEAAAALANAPEREGPYFKVPRIL